MPCDRQENVESLIATESDVIFLCAFVFWKFGNTKSEFLSLFEKP